MSNYNINNSWLSKLCKMMMKYENHNYSDRWDDAMILEKWLFGFASKMVGWSNSTI